MIEVADIRLRYVHRNKSRHGTIRWYFRKPEQALVRLPDDPASEEFMREYRRCLAGEKKPEPAKPKTIKEGSLRALVTAYFGSTEFAALSDATKNQRRRVAESMCQEPLKEGDERVFADIPLGAFKGKHARVLRDRKALTPEAANHRLKVLRQVFSWGCEHEWVKESPIRDVKALVHHSDGHHTWTVEEVERYLEVHDPGSKARLAIGLLLFMGIRISDLALIGRQHRRGDVHIFRPYKGREKTPKVLELPVLPELDAILATSQLGDMTYLVTEHRKPFTIKGLGNKFRDWCDAADLQHCSAHGLRKAGATIAAENGANEEDLKAIFGWENAKEANLYTRKARQKVIARRAISLINFGAGVTGLIQGENGCTIARSK